MISTSRFRISSRTVLVLAVVGTLLPYSIYQVSRVPLRIGFYTDRTIPTTAETYRSLGTIAIDMDQSREWGQLWARTLAVQAYEIRTGRERNFCLGKGWHLSNTEQARCTPEQLAARPHVVARWAPAFPELTGAVAGDQWIAFYPP